jgi:tetratricopeptide (TPR) repeat protein
VSRGRGLLAYGLVALIAAALVVQTGRLRSRIQAGQLLRRVEARTYEAVVTGRLPFEVASANQADLDRAAGLDPLEVGIPLAYGSQYLLMQQPDSAIELYRRALEIEPRPEIYLNLGRAELQSGRIAEARDHFKTALALDPSFFSQIPQLPEGFP